MNSLSACRKHKLFSALLLAASVTVTLTAGALAAEKAPAAHEAPKEKTAAAAMPEMPKPTAEHQWLQQFVGEWKSDAEAYMEPGKEPVRMTGTESVKPLGEFWTISEVKSTMMDQPFTGNMTLGYDPKKKKYIGTWVDSMTGQLWEYEGTVDSTGKILTLNAEGSCPMNPGKMTKFKDVVELKDKNTKVMTSSMLGEDGKWVTMMTSTAKRVD
ncbi:MAG: DUF1579 domain-containing protein [Candidatus Doudnabacteria bacterium]|nr:DUF1579 domain-containing protein [Candidatus Doudnabacteria bacterium]